MEDKLIEQVVALITQNSGMNAALVAAGVGVVVTAVKAILRMPKKTSQGGVYLTDTKLLTPPKFRPAYSDRMAYILAEMSALAYFKFESQEEGALEEAIEKFLQLSDVSRESVQSFLAQYQHDLLLEPVNSQSILAKMLGKVDFQLLDTINVNSTQGFVCKRMKEGEEPYLVVAFRGTEKVVSDWLTDADAKPATCFGEDIKVHNGFWQALSQSPESDSDSQSVLDKVKAILDSDEAKQDGEKLPCYFTGHSLGGALALMTTREIASDISGACYTFGAPRVACYHYFSKMKTPVYRVVNSSDIVPRVPPGAIMGVLLKLIQGTNWVIQFVPGVARPMAWLEQKVDQLNGYRHHGDLRYLTDVKADNFEQVQLLCNPPLVDRIWWMWQHAGNSLWWPVKSHGMAIYRRKLQQVATRRNH